MTEVRGEHAESAALLAEAIESAMSIRDSWTFTLRLSELASVAVRVGDVESAARLFGASAASAARYSVLDGWPTTAERRRLDLEQAQTALGADRFARERQTG